MTVSNPLLNGERPVVPAGFFVVDKPAGLSSAGVSNRIKWLLKPMYGKNVKIGHGGTLDPFATGILPIGLGAATKRLQELLEGDKTYRFTVTFGTQTSTDDIEGEVIARSDILPEREAVEAVLERFRGEIEQVPPVFSALKVDGQRAYALARKGEAVELAARKVTIERLELMQMAGDTAVFEARVSKGTYIRVLGREIARAVGTVGHVSQLARTEHGPFTMQDAVSLEMLDKALQMGDWKPYLRPLDACPAPKKSDQQA